MVVGFIVLPSVAVKYWRRRRRDEEIASCVTRCHGRGAVCPTIGGDKVSVTRSPARSKELITGELK